MDGACCSGLIAIHDAAEKVATGMWDYGVVGAVDISIDALELIGFSKGSSV